MRAGGASRAHVRRGTADGVDVHAAEHVELRLVVRIPQRRRHCPGRAFVTGQGA
ncbi:hypothetical protein H4W80_002998 [Nonomuraea angiospora]|uniref:Transposase n=1 Tax=Nonomuraea angiospora TaxID=46172 RepID=A0ABR9LWM8_9ACTN|nr:hypothetical protein [Nonomuraea angiospora]